MRRAGPPSPRSRFWPGVLAIGLGVPAIFWLKFRVIDAYALAFTAFLLIVVFAIQFIPKLNDEYGADLAARTVEPKWFDRLGVVWLLSIPFAPFLGWVVKSVSSIGADNWRLILGIRSFLCVALPLLCVLPLLRYVRGRAAPYALLILFIGTAFPVSTGLSSTLDLIHGAIWESVVIARVEHATIVVDGHESSTSVVHVTLTDGRALQLDSDRVRLHAGPARVLVLKAIGEIIAVQ